MLSDVIIYSFLAGLATFAGIFLLVYKEKWARKNSIYLISFSAGILIGAAFIFLVPEAIGMNNGSIIYILAGFLSLYLLENIIVIHSCKEEKCDRHAIGSISIVGLALHSLIDGIAIGIGFEISKNIGLIAALGVLSHEIPEGISSMSILLHAGMAKKKAIAYSSIVAVATPVGAVLTFFFLKNITQSLLGIFLAIAAGTFIYIAASDLVPETHERISNINAIILLIGVALVYSLSIIF